MLSEACTGLCSSAMCARFLFCRTDMTVQVCSDIRLSETFMSGAFYRRPTGALSHCSLEWESGRGSKHGVCQGLSLWRGCRLEG